VTGESVSVTRENLRARNSDDATKVRSRDFLYTGH
jgi:hypothetical protein